jgi:hypothetical protein
MRPGLKLAVVTTLLLTLPACASAPATTSSGASATSTRAAASPTPTAKTSTTPTPVAAECPATPIDVTITYELVPDAGGGVRIDAESNLPDGAVMNASFYRVGGGYTGQDDGVLKGGKITFGPYSDKGTPLQGIYDMSITLPIATNQPDSVQACIGAAGELLTGPLVSTEEITGDQVANVEAVITFE